MVGLIVTTENEMSTVEYDSSHCDIIRKAVGGRYEHVRPVGLEPPYCMMVNEEGLLLNLPVNLLGSILYDAPRHGYPIVGDIIILKEGYFGGEPDLVGMTVKEAQSLGNRFSVMSGGFFRWVKV